MKPGPMHPTAMGNVFWAGLEAVVSGVLAFAAAFIVARLIGPSEFGIGAAAVAVHVLLWVGVNAVFSDALVQRRSLGPTTAASALWASVMVGGAAALVQAAAGWALAAALGDSRLFAMGLLLAWPLPLVGAGGALQGLLTRQRRYRTLAARALVGQGLGTAAGIAAALAGAGAWAPVLQQAVGSGAGALTLLIRTPWRPRLVCRWAAVRALLRIGLPLTASTLVLTARYRLFALLLAGSAGPAALGETHMAFRLVDSVRELSFTALWRLTLPLLAEHQGNIAALRARCDRLLALTSLAMLPLCGAMALSLPPLVRLMLGPAWELAGVAAEPLVALMALLSLMFPAGVAVVARGRTGLALAGSVACTSATLAGMALLPPHDAFHAVLVWLGAQAVALPYALWLNGDTLGSGPLRPLRHGLPMLGVTLAGLVAALAVPRLTGEPAAAVALAAFRLAMFAVVVVPGAWLVAIGPGLGWFRRPPPGLPAHPLTGLR
jgi:PST family polysaccharide transporter